MKKDILKRAGAFFMAGALVVTGVQIPAVQADAAWTWNSLRSESGYYKITSGVTATAESAETASPRPASNVTDGDVSSIWHTQWSNGYNAFTNDTTAITLTLDEPQRVKGITYLPSQQAANENNGMITACEVSISTDGSTFEQVTEQSWNYSNSTTPWADAIAEREIIFDQTYESVKAVKLKATSSSGTTGNTNKFVSAAEIALLTQYDIAEAPAVSIAAPVAGGEKPEAELLAETYTSYDKAANPATLTLSDNFAKLEDTEYADAFSGRVIAEREALNNSKLDKAASDKLAITFKHKCNEYPGDGVHIIDKVRNGDTEYVLQYTDGNKIILFANTQGTTSNWPQFQYTLPDNYWGAWHDISLCFTDTKINLFVDGSRVTIDSDRASYNQQLTLRNGIFKINSGNNANMSFAEFKMYTGSNLPSGEISDISALNASLPDAELLFQFGETTVSRDLNYSVSDTEWLDGDTETAEFVGGGSYTVNITLAANKGYIFKQIPETILLGETETQVSGSISADGETMTLTCNYALPTDIYAMTCGYVNGSSALTGDISVNPSSAGEGESAVFTATPKEGNVFQGWYRDAEGTDLYSADAVTEYVNEGAAVTLYAKFKQMVFKEAAYWDYESANGTLAEQGQDDVWYYQIKQNDVWANIADSLFNADGNMWLTPGGSAAYYWAKLEKNVITPCFSRADHQGLGYVWRAQEDGYVKVSFENDFELNPNKADVPFAVRKVPVSELSGDGETLMTTTLDASETPVSKDALNVPIVKVQAGDYIRISADKADNDVQNVSAVVTLVTVSDYAREYLDRAEVKAKLAKCEAGEYTATTSAAVTAAKSALDAVLDTEDTAVIETNLETLKTAIENLAEWCNVTAGPVTGSDGSGTASATINGEAVTKAEPNQTVTYTAQAADGYVFEGWYEDADGTASASTENPLEIVVTSDTARYAKFVVDKSELESVIQTAAERMAEEGYEGKYTQVSRTALATAKAAAEEVESNADATPTDVADAVSALNAAIAGLTSRADITGLQAAIESAEAKQQEAGYDNYTEESKQALADALATAQRLSADADAVQAEVDDAKTALEAAVNGLEWKAADYTEVDAAVTAANAIDRTLYTDESLAVLDAAVNAVATGKDITEQDAVDAMAEAINSAIAGLERHYTVTVVKGTLKEDRKYKYGEMATVTADAPESGKKFAYWETNGKPVCYAASYSFYVMSDTTVTACYVASEDEVKQQVTMTCTSVYNVSTKKITFTAKRSLPEGCKVLEHGIIITDSTGWNNFKDNEEEKFVVGASRIRTAKGKTTGLLGNYSASLTCTKSDKWYGKGYVRYQAPDGTEAYAYSSVTQCTVIVE